MKKLEAPFAYFFTAFMIFVGITGIVLFFDSKKNPDRLIQPAYTTDFEGNPKTVFRPGEDMLVRYHIDRLRDCRTIRVNRKIENGVVVPLSSHNGALAKKYPNGFSVHVHIPKFLQPDDYRYIVSLETKCNFLFHTFKTYPPVKFTLIK